MFATPKTPLKPGGTGAAPDDGAPPPLPKSSSKSVKAKAMSMLKLGEKILPDASREHSMRSLSSLLHHPQKTPSKEASMKAIPMEPSFKQPPLQPQVSAPLNDAPAKTSTPAKETTTTTGASAFELLIADMSKLRVQLRKTVDDLEVERNTGKELRSKLDAALTRESRRNELKVLGKTEQALAEELKRVDALLEEERTVSATLEARVRQLEDEVDSAQGKEKIAELEAEVANLKEQLAGAAAATAAVIGKSKHPESADIVFRAAKQEADQAKAQLAQRMAQHTKEAESLREQIEELKRVVADKAREHAEMEKRAEQAEAERRTMFEELEAKNAEYEAAMQQAIDEVARLDAEAKANEQVLASKTAELQALKPLVEAAKKNVDEGKRAEAKRMGEQQRDMAVAAAKKLFRDKKISQKEFDSVIEAANQALKSVEG